MSDYVEFFGGNREAFDRTEPEVLLSGPAGTGKTRAALTKLFLAAEMFPGCRLLIIRKVRESLTEAALVTFEQKVVPQGHPCLDGPSRPFRKQYTFPNGSVIVVAGLDKPGKVMSTEWDIVYVQEAIELTENDWESLTTRLRNGVLPYQQLIADTNPDRPLHWLKQRCNRGQTLLIESRHEDNPTVIDQKTGQPTPAGKVYLDKLDKLTGARKPRLRWGRWVQAEGVVYELWDANEHLIDPFPIPAHWRRFWVLDFGFTNPFVWQWWAEDDDGRLYLYREIYLSRNLVSDLAEKGLKQIGAWDDGEDRADWSRPAEPRPAAVIADHDAEDRATFERVTKVRTTAAPKASKVSVGVQDVQDRLKVQADGKPRLFIFRNARCHPSDPALVEQKKPTCTAEEVDGYVWDDSAAKGERPVKDDDHGMDAMRYVCHWRATRPTIPLTPETVAVGAAGVFAKGLRALAAPPGDADADDDRGDSLFARNFRGV